MNPMPALPQTLLALSPDWRLVTLANGLRLITIARPGTLTVAVRAYVRAGSRYDAEESDRPSFGLAHFCEHLLFKGSHDRSQRQLFARVERLGGVLEAGTAKEYTHFYTVPPASGLATALEVLAEILARPALREEGSQQEKLVVLNEIRLAQDRQGILFDLFSQTLWQEHPLCYPVLGTLDGVQELVSERVRAFYGARYVAGNMVLVVCGDIEHDRTGRLVAEHFAKLPPRPRARPTPGARTAIARPTGRPVVTLYIISSLVGIVLFGRVFSSGEYSLVATAGGSITLGLFTLFAAQFVSIMLHELAHALTVKRYRREVRRAGVMICMGLPGFSVDTTDIWMEGKRARLAVSLSSPFSGLVLAGLASTVITLWPDFALNSVLLKFAFLSYLLVFLNLNPLLQLDGYYLLMDWLEIPMLRSKSLAFIRHGLPAKLKGNQRSPEEGSNRPNWLRQIRSFSREERIFTVFGILSAIWAVFAVCHGLRFWQTRLAGTVRSLPARRGPCGASGPDVKGHADGR